MRWLILLVSMTVLSCSEKEQPSPWDKYPIKDANGMETGEYNMGAEIEGVNQGGSTEKKATLVLTLQDGRLYMKVNDENGQQVKFNNGPTNIITNTDKNTTSSQIFWTNNVAMDQKGQILSLLRLYKEVELIIDEAARNPASPDKFTFLVRGIDQ
jgi:hypothetical protein